MRLRHDLTSSSPCPCCRPCPRRGRRRTSSCASRSGTGGSIGNACGNACGSAGGNALCHQPPQPVVRRRTARALTARAAVVPRQGVHAALYDDRNRSRCAERSRTRNSVEVAVHLVWVAAPPKAVAAPQRHGAGAHGVERLLRHLQHVHARLCRSVERCVPHGHQVILLEPRGADGLCSFRRRHLHVHQVHGGPGLLLLATLLLPALRPRQEHPARGVQREADADEGEQRAVHRRSRLGHAVDHHHVRRTARRRLCTLRVGEAEHMRTRRLCEAGLGGLVCRRRRHHNALQAQHAVHDAPAGTQSCADRRHTDRARHVLQPPEAQRRFLLGSGFGRVLLTHRRKPRAEDADHVTELLGRLGVGCVRGGDGASAGRGVRVGIGCDGGRDGVGRGVALHPGCRQRRACRGSTAAPASPASAPAEAEACREVVRPNHCCQEGGCLCMCMCVCVKRINEVQIL
eukprot:Rhum_TRINITY_DN14669_c1_g1::Rhum_TRINITY_DN14669_c1_g1_i1::g.107150::m.107150